MQAKKSTLNRVLSYVGRYPLALGLSLFFALLSVASSLLVPIFIGDAVDCIVEGGVLWEELFLIFIKIGVAVLGLTSGNYVVNPNDVDAYLASTLGQKMTAQQMVGLVSNTTNVAQTTWPNTFDQAVTAASFKQAAASMLGMTVAEYEAYLNEQGEIARQAALAEGKSPFEARNLATQKKNELQGNIMVAVSAYQAQSAGQDILAVLKKGEAGKDEIKTNLKNGDNAAKGVSQAALAYGLYTSYVKYMDETADPDLSAFALALEGGDANFTKYLNGTLDGADVNTDLKGLMGAMNAINGQSADAIMDAFINGFNNSDVADNLAAILGK